MYQRAVPINAQVPGLQRPHPSAKPYHPKRIQCRLRCKLACGLCAACCTMPVRNCPGATHCIEHIAYERGCVAHDKRGCRSAECVQGSAAVVRRTEFKATGFAPRWQPGM